MGINMIEINVKRAKQGDCIWIRCSSAEENINIIIDAGPSSFKAGFKKLMKEIKKNDEKIDLLIFSHIDDDHIRGCIPYLKEYEEKMIDRVWINGSGSRVYLQNQEHSARNVSSLVELIHEKGILVETPILEGKEYKFLNGKIKVIAPTEKEMMNVAEKIEYYNQFQQHAGGMYRGDILKAPEKKDLDSSPTNTASIIVVLEFDDKKLLFTGDAPADNIIASLDKYYPTDRFEIVKLPHHGSYRNITRELIRRIDTNQVIISTNKQIQKIVLRRLIEEKEGINVLCNDDWWNNEYFTVNDMEEVINEKKLIIKDIGEEKVIL